MAGVGGGSWQGRASHTSGIEQCVAAWHGMHSGPMQLVPCPAASKHGRAELELTCQLCRVWLSSTQVVADPCADRKGQAQRQHEDCEQLWGRHGEAWQTALRACRALQRAC